jgi:[ribosomal protein S18]-alanine N-acetyltransferase
LPVGGNIAAAQQAPAADLVIRRASGNGEYAWCAHLMADSEPWITLGRDYTACLALLSNPNKELYVAALAAKLAGLVLVDMNGGLRGYIQSICVAPDLRGRGIGARLLHFAEARIFKETPNVFICVSSFNPDAERLYLRLGYKRVGELTDFIIPGASEILLRKSSGPIRDYSPQSTVSSD